jgi:hypothetical protein
MKWRIVLAVLVAACSGDSKPSAGRSTPTFANVAGTWNVNWSNLNTRGVSCLAIGGHMTLSQSGATFSGVYGGALLQCNGVVVGLASGPVVNGSVGGSSIAFEMDTPDLHQSGAISRNSMSGSAVWRVGVSGQVVTLAGNWAAMR